jgi:hypothetical protein
MKNSGIASFFEEQSDPKVSWIFNEPFALKKIPKTARVTL